MKSFKSFTILIFLCFAFAGCWESESENTAEDIGESIGKTTEQIGESIKKGTERSENLFKDGTSSLKDAAKDAGDETHESGQEISPDN